MPINATILDRDASPRSPRRPARTLPPCATRGRPAAGSCPARVPPLRVADRHELRHPVDEAEVAPGSAHRSARRVAVAERRECRRPTVSRLLRRRHGRPSAPDRRAGLAVTAGLNAIASSAPCWFRICEITICARRVSSTRRSELHDGTQRDHPQQPDGAEQQRRVTKGLCADGFREVSRNVCRHRADARNGVPRRVVASSWTADAGSGRSDMVALLADAVIGPSRGGTVPTLYLSTLQSTTGAFAGDGSASGAPRAPG